MPTNIESRIVSMIFDNAQFEKGVATSKKTLKDFDEQLKFKDADKNFRTLTDAAKQVSFSSIVSSAEDMGVRIKASTIAGAEMIKRLTNSAIDFAQTVAHKVVAPISGALNQIQTGGWNRATNIDQAKFQLEGLGVAWEDISEDIDYGVKDTAYGLDSAARVASQLVASSVELGDDMKAALRGISGVAAMTNSTYDDIGAVFTRVAGQGRVMANDLNSLASRGLNAAAELGKAMGKTEAEIREMVSKGQIDFKTFSYYMDKAFGQHAKEANKTFEGAMANMNSALSRIGAEFASSYRANMIPVYNALRTTFNAVKGSMGEVFTVADAIMTDLSDRFTKYVGVFNRYVIESGALKSIFNGIANYAEGAYNVVTAIVDTIINAYRIVVPDLHGMGVEMSKWGQFADEFKKDVFRKPAAAFHNMSKSFLDMTQNEDFIKKLVNALKTVVSIISTVVSIIKTIWGYAKNLIANIKWAIQIPKKSISEILDSVLGFLKTIHAFLISDSFKRFFAQIEWSIISVIRFFKLLWGMIKTAGNTISEVWQNIFPTTSISSIIDKMSTILGRFMGMLGDLYSYFSTDTKYTTALKNGFTALAKVVKVLSGVFKIIGTVVNVVFTDMMSLFRVARDAFYEVFDGGTEGTDKLVGGLLYAIQAIIRFVKSLVFSEKTLDNFKRIFKGVFTVVQLAKDIFVGVFQVISTVVGRAFGSMSEESGGIIETITGIVAKIADWIVALKAWLDEHDAISKVVTFLVRVFGGIITFIEKLVSWIKQAASEFDAFVLRVTGSTLEENFDKIKDSISGVWEKIKETFGNIAKSKEIDDAEEKVSPLSKLWEILKSAFSGFTDFLSAAWPGIQKIFTALSNLLTGIIDIVGEVASKLDFPTLTSAALGVAGIIGAWQGTFGTLSILQTKLNSFFYNLNQSLSSFNKTVEANNLVKIASAILLLAIALVAVSTIDSDKLLGALGAFETLVLTLGSFSKSISKFAASMSVFKKPIIDSVGSMMIKIAAALLLMSIALSKLAQFNMDQIGTGLFAITALMAILVGSIKYLGKNVSSMTKVGGTMMAIAIALMILTVPMKSFAKMEWEQIGKGLAAIGGLLFELALFAMALNGKKIFMAGLAISSIAKSITLLIIPMKFFAKMEWEQIGRGLATIGGLLFELAIFANMATGTKIFGAAMAILLLATSMAIMISPMKEFATLEWEQIGKGLAAVGGLLLEFGIFTAALSGSHAVLAAISIMALAAAMKTMVQPMKELGNLEWEQIGRGLVSVGGLLAEFVIAALLLNFAGLGAVVAVLTIMGLAKALTMLVDPMRSFGRMKWSSIGKGLALVGGALALLVLAGLGAKFVAGGLLALGASLVLMGLGAKLLASAMDKAAGALTKFIVPLKALESIKWSSIGKALLIMGGFTLVMGALALLGMPLLKVAAAFLVISAAVFIVTAALMLLAVGLGMMSDAFGTNVNQALQVLIDATPLFMEWISQLVNGLLDVVIKAIPKLCQIIEESIPLILHALVVLLAELAKFSYEAVRYLVDIVVNVILGILDGVAARAQEIVNSILNLVWQIVKAVFIGLWNYVVMFFNWFVSNIWPTLKEFFAGIWAAISGWFVGLWTDVSNWFDTTWQTIKDWGKELINKLGEGISETIDSIVGFFEGMWQDVQDFFSNIWEGVKGLGRKFVGFFTGGVEEDPNTVYNTTYELGKQAEQGLIDATNTHSPSVDTTNIGSYFGEGMYNGMGTWTTKIHDMGFGLGEEGVTGLGEGLGGIGDTLQNAISGLPEEDTQLSITPVIDMDNLQVKGDDNLQWYSDLNGTPVDSNTNLFSQFTADNAQAVAAQESNNQLTEQTLTELQGMREDNVTSSEATVASLDSMASKIEMLQTELIGKFNDLSRVQIQNNANTNAEITNIRSDLSVLATAVNNMKVVLDTGAIAGDITPKIDVRLGREAAYRGRGIK